MAEFHGTVELISGITPKNGGDFALVGAHDVQIDNDGNRLDTEFSNLKSASNELYQKEATTLMNFEDLLSISGYTASNGALTASSNAKRSRPIFLKAGETIYVKLLGGSGSNVLSAYSSADASASTYIDGSGIAGVGTTVYATGSYTAVNDCYVIISCYLTSSAAIWNKCYAYFDTSLQPQVDSLKTNADDTAAYIEKVSPMIFDKETLFSKNAYVNINGVRLITSNTYRCSELMLLQKGHTISYKLNGADGVYVFSAYSAKNVSSDTLISYTAGTGTVNLVAGSYTAEEDCYVVVCAYLNSAKYNNAYAVFSNNIPSQINALNERVTGTERHDEELEPRFLNKEELFCISGYVTTSGSKVGSANYKRSNLILLQNGHSVEYALTGSTGVYVLAVFSRKEISQDALIASVSVAGIGTTVHVRGTYTATADCYIVVSTYYNTVSYRDSNAFFSDSIRKNIDDNTNFRIYKNDNITSASHRGYSSLAPESTIPAFAESKRKGFEWVETDVRYTYDGTPVLMHDETINRSCCMAADGSSISETVTVASIHDSDLALYDACTPEQWSVWAGTKITTFEEFVVFCKRAGLKAYVEIKVSPAVNVLNIAKKCNMQDNIKWCATSNLLLAEIVNAYEKANVVLVHLGVTSTEINAAVALKTGYNKVSIMTTDYASITDEIVASMIENELALEIYTGSPNASYTCHPYVSGIVSDGFIGGYEAARYALTT